MGRRNRRRGRLETPTTDYPDGEGNVLTLRDAMSPATRREYHDVLHGNRLSQEDAWQRAVEFLFERLAVRWTIAGVPTVRQKELVGRFRMTSAAERDWIRGVLREHVGEHFPELEAP
jgi:hypothetical protein